MSDPQTIWRLGVALACAGGAWWMKVAGSGVCDEAVCNEGRGRNAGSGGVVLGVGVDRCADHRSAAAMKGTHGTADGTAPASNVVVVDFAHRRAVNDLRRRLDSLGVAHRLSDPVVKR